MIYLTITDDAVAYHATATEAALAAGIPPWATAPAACQINALAPGDELSVSRTASVIRLTGVDREFKS